MREFKNLGDITAHWAASEPEAEAIKVGGRTISHSLLHQRIGATVEYLRTFDLQFGDRVLYIGRNDEMQLLLFFACARLSLRLVLVNWRLSAREVNELVRDADPAVVFATPECAALIAGLDSQRLTRVMSSQALAQATENLTSSPCIPQPRIDDETDLILCYTSGSTGRPKGVRQTHGNWRAAVEMARSWQGGNWHQDSRSLCTLPFFHVAGLRAAVLVIAVGGCAVLPIDSSVAALCELIDTENVTTISVVPTLLLGLIEGNAAKSRKLSTLETIFYGAAPMPVSLLTRARAQLGCAFVQTYGATETTGIAVALDDVHHFPPHDFSLSCGRPLPGITVEVRSSGGVVLGPGISGQIWLKGRTVAAGYWNDLSRSHEDFRDGWFRPGDLGKVDADGFVYLEGRASDVIRTGGEKVHPIEVERILQSHRTVDDVAVYGLADEKWGESVCATIVVAAGEALDVEELQQYCREKLAAFKVPRRIDAASVLPRNANGKVLRRVLQAERV